MKEPRLHKPAKATAQVLRKAIDAMDQAQAQAPAPVPQPVAGLLVGRADDPAEARADARADRAVAVLDRLSRAETDPTAGAAEPLPLAVPGRLHRAVAPGSSGDPAGPAGGELDSATAAQIRQQASGGSALPAALRRSMEGAFGGADFSGVRLHTDATAQQLSSNVGARAFTLDSHIFVGEQTDLSRGAGRHLLAHELSHTLDNAPGTAHRQIRRLMKASDLSADKTRGVLGKLTTSSYALIRDGISAYHKVSDQERPDRDGFGKGTAAVVAWHKAAGEYNEKKINMLHGLIHTVEEYVKTRKSSTRLREPDLSRLKVISRLLPELKEELGDTQYVLAHFRGGGSILDGKGNATDEAAGEKGFQGLSSHTGRDTPAGQLKAGAARNLSEAEVMAIRTFTSNDYLYINPSVANVPGWNVPGKDDKQKAIRGEEGAAHNAMMAKGLDKLAVFTDETYRGQVLTQAEFDKFYAGSIYTQPTFASSSAKEMKAVSFLNQAKYEIDKLNPVNDKNVAVVATIINHGGRDIDQVSSVVGEAEVILPPQKFMVRIDQVTDTAKLTKNDMQILGKTAVGVKKQFKRVYVITLIGQHTQQGQGS